MFWIVKAVYYILIAVETGHFLSAKIFFLIFFLRRFIALVGILFPIIPLFWEDTKILFWPFVLYAVIARYRVQHDKYSVNEKYANVLELVYR